MDNLNINQVEIHNRIIPFHGISMADVIKESAVPKFNGAVSGPMWEKVSNLGSAYPDTFDWGMYDRLKDKFGENQPRGGAVFKTNFKVVNSHPQCSKCHYSFEMDTYGRGCVHNCIYCYAKDQLTLKGYWNKPHPMPIDLSEVRKIFYTVFETDKPSKWRSVLENRIPLRIGSMSDSFMWMDQKYKVTLELLKILKFYEYPHVVFTRSDLVAHDDYMAEMSSQLSAIQFSISGHNEQMTKLIEPGAPSVKRRLSAIKKLSDAGFWTAVRINPLFPTYPDGYFTNRKDIDDRFGKDIPKFGLLDIENCDEFFDSVKESKANTLLAGFVRLNQTSISKISRATDVEFKKFFHPERYTNSGESHYSDSEIAYYYKIMQSKSVKRGIRFSTCYIGNGVKDYFQYQGLWDNKKDCCDIAGNLGSFKKTSQDIPWETRIKHAPTKDLPNRVKALEAEIESATTTVGLTTSIIAELNSKAGLLKSKGLEWDTKRPT